MSSPRSLRLWLTLLVSLLLSASVASAEVVIEWVTVNGAGNACDTQIGGCYGSVASPYRIAKFEVTNAQYTEFLNAVAVTDPNGLYYANMGGGFGGITRSGSSPGSYGYSTISGRGDMPVLYVSFWSAARFANWLHNGQPTGLQGSGTTEDGAYTLTPTGITNNTVTRNGGALVFVPSEDEWYKAAYYDPGAMLYYDYPAGSDTQTTCAVSGAAANTADCSYINGDQTDVGSYTGAASPVGTFDQGASVAEWNETIISVTNRGMRGGSFISGPSYLAASSRGGNISAGVYYDAGFRVASSSSAPAVPSVSVLGIAMLGGLLGLVGSRRLRA